MARIIILLFFVFFFSFANAQAVGDYRSAASGTWGTATNWETWNGTSWVVAGVAPTNANGVITVQAGHMMNILAAISLDQVVVNGTVNLKNVALTITNAAGDDLIINGCFEDSSNTTVVFNGGAVWSIAAGATLIRCAGGGPTPWQNSYSGGISVIPSTANWINRKSGTANPSLITIGGFYPNLIIENKNAANWVTTAGSTFNGAGGFPTIKGNLDIGGTQTGTVDFLSNCTNAQAVLVYGNVTVKSGSKMRNFGTGLEVQGNLTVNGDVNHVGGTGTRKIIFSGGNAQTISGTGNLNIYAIVINKSAGTTVTLSRKIYIDNSATFTSGTITSSSSFPVVFDNNATVSSISAASFVNGPVIKYDNGVLGNFTFPVGKNSDYQALDMSGTAETPFWTETFSNGCASGCLANTYSGPNGAWTVTATGTNDATNNPFYVSYAEDGNGVGVCGTAGTNLDPSLHVGSNSIGDAGAAYDAGGACGIFYCVTTNLRAESPTINCTGKSNLLVSFNYLEFGSGTLDNATFWYYDGTSWSQLVDLPKTYCCGGVNCTGSNQGLWQNYRFMLPATANNNANVKIGFNWTNNDDGVGTDPSFAVDDITIADNYWTGEYFYANPQVVYNNNLAATLSAIDGCEYWTLDRNASAGTKTVTLTWDANTCPSIPQVSDTRVAHFDLGNTNIWQDEGNGANTGTISAGTVSSAAAVTYFSPFTIGLIPPTPLPIELIHFDGTCADGTVLLNWETASEQNNNFFTIEKSEDGIIFSPVGNVNGSGNSDQLLHYSFEDKNPKTQINYYRIKQTDFNGQFSYSRIIVVDSGNCKGKNLVVNNAWFNNNDLEVDYQDGNSNVQIVIYSSDGKLVSHFDMLPSSANYHIATEELSNSIYFIRISDGFTTITKTIVK